MYIDIFPSFRPMIFSDIQCIGNIPGEEIETELQNDRMHPSQGHAGPWLIYWPRCSHLLREALTFLFQRKRTGVVKGIFYTGVSSLEWDHNPIADDALLSEFDLLADIETQNCNSLQGDVKQL